MPIPLIAAAAAAAAKTAGGLVGGIGAYNDTQRGMSAQQNLSNQGIATLQSGKVGAEGAYSPYTTAGGTGVTGYLNSIQGRQNAQMATVGDNSAQTAMSRYLDPSAAYSTDQANKATQASALAKGGMGGGLAKALSNNANKMAMTNFNNAVTQNMNANAQTFGQQNQNYQNQTAYDQSQISNYGNLANMGLGATNNLQSLLGQYNIGIDTNLRGQGDNAQSAWSAKGKIWDDTSKGFGNNLAGGITSMWGGK